MNEFSRVMAPVVGAADLVLGMHQGAQRLAEGRVAMARQRQTMEFDRELQPLRVRLAEEQAAGANLRRLAGGYSLWQAVQAEGRRARSDIEAEKALSDLWSDFSGWKTGRAAIGAGVLPLPDDVLGSRPVGGGPTSGSSIYDDLGEIRPGGEATSGGLLPDTMLDGPPFEEAGDLAEGVGDGSDGRGIAEREIEAQAARKPGAGGIVEREIEAQARKRLAMPRSVALHERLKMTVQAFGGAQAIAARRPDLIPRLVEMEATLMGDPEAAQWNRDVEIAIKQRVARDAVLGKIASAGLPAGEFSGVLAAIEAGLPVDPGTIDERIKSTLAARNALATAYAAKGDMSLAGGYFALPEMVRKRAEDLSALYMKSPEFANLSLATGYAANVRQLADAQKALVAAGKEPSAAADIAMVYSYMKVLDPTTAVREAEYATAENAAGVPDRVRNMFNKLRDGSFLTPEQREEFAASAQTALLGLRSTLQARQKVIEGQLSGLVPAGVMPLVRQQVFGETAAAGPANAGALPPAPGVKGVYNTPEELNAAIARGEVNPEADTVLYQGQVIRMKKAAGK